MLAPSGVKWTQNERSEPLTTLSCQRVSGPIIEQEAIGPAASALRIVTSPDQSTAATEPVSALSWWRSVSPGVRSSAICA